MKTTTYICNHCGKSSADHPDERFDDVSIRVTPMDATPGGKFNDYYLDLCAACASFLREWAGAAIKPLKQG